MKPTKDQLFYFDCEWVPIAKDLQEFEEKKYESKDIWNDGGDRFFIRDGKGDLVIFYEY